MVKTIGFLCCTCGSPVTVKEDRSLRRSLVSSIALHCTVCTWSTKLTNSYSEEDLEVNQWSVLAARAVGRGRSGLSTFTGFMGMLPPISQALHVTH